MYDRRMSESSRDIVLPIVAGLVVLVVAGTSAFAVVAWKRVREHEVRTAPSTPSGATLEATVDPYMTTPSVAPITTSTTPHVLGPRGDAVVGSTSVGSETVARLRPGFRSCYNKGLQVDPSMEGNVVLTARFDADGDVVSVTKKSGSGLSTDVEQCLIRRLRHASFAQAAGGGTVDVPITLVPAVEPAR